MMKITAVLVLLGVATVMAVVIPNTCGHPNSGNANAGANSTTGTSGGFDYALCTGFTGSSATCGTSGAQGAVVTFTYKTVEADQAGPLYFQLIPTGSTGTTTKFHIKATAPGYGLLGSALGYTQESDTANSKIPLTSADPIVSWVDAEHTFQNPAGADISFAVSCTAGNSRTETFNYALWNAGSVLEWASTGASEGTYGTAVTAGVPCCGPVEVSWALNGVATEHLYIEAKLSQVAGKWASATMDNVSGFDDTQPFDNNGYGSAKVRTCVTNQSCTTEAEVYYISAKTAATSDTDGWVQLEMTLRASAGVVGVSVATVAAVILAHLF